MTRIAAGKSCRLAGLDDAGAPDTISFSPVAPLKPVCVMTCMSRGVNQRLSLIRTWNFPSSAGFDQRTAPCTCIEHRRPSFRSRFVKVELDQGSDELENLLALVEGVKGRHEFQ